ncbi:hypothetical protein FF100_35855 [Methylobacterium terricola]|uniref:Uncharacterized protein n=1 Tax=Methylobacterium terricola TaxID=2583531 RepID=A0A5C4L5P0_9HYPH|nr:hypothetical protein [Methylobacterium terricola]TNC05287.1 hypothetical protein FF100_35855 [Methylobacterium terricola]
MQLVRIRERFTMHPLVPVAFLSVLFLVPAAAQDAGGLPPPEATGRPAAGKPANLCRELVVFVHQPDAAQNADAPPAQLATAVSAKKESAETAKPHEGGGQVQQNSGLSGQITTSGPGAAGPQGDAQNKGAPAGSTATAAAGTPAMPPVKPTLENVQEVEKASAENNLRGCRAAAQRMRKAGVMMPSPLLALSAMDPKLLEAAGQP